MVDIFVSYKREERPRISPLVDELRGHGREVWIDAKTKVSASFIVEINRALEACKCAVVFWSRHSVRSNWVLAESYTAYEKEKLIPVLLDNVVVPAPFNLLQAVDLTRWNGDYKHADWLELTQAVAEYCAPPAAAVPVRKKAAKKQSVDHEEEAPKPISAKHVLTSKEKKGLEREIIKLVEDGGGAIASARIAQALRTNHPEIENFDWFGHPTFRDLFNALQIDELIFELAPPGIVRLKRSDAQALTERQKTHDTMVSEVFELTEAPLLSDHEFRSVFFAIAKAISEGSVGRSSIAKAARDSLSQLGISISRAKIDYIITGAIFGGVDIKDRTTAGIVVGKCFAKSLATQCGAHGWFVDDAGLNVILQILGLSEVSIDEIRG